MGQKLLNFYLRRLQRPTTYSTLKIPQNIWLIRSYVTNWNISTETALVTDKLG